MHLGTPEGEFVKKIGGRVGARREIPLDRNSSPDGEPSGLMGYKVNSTRIMAGKKPAD
jgi:hypothetical protein